MKAFVFTFYFNGDKVTALTLYAMDENDAMKRADNMLRNNPLKYDDWAMNY